MAELGGITKEQRRQIARLLYEASNGPLDVDEYPASMEHRILAPYLLEVNRFILIASCIAKVLDETPT